MEKYSISRVLGGEKVLGHKIKNKMDLIEISEQGITRNALEHLANFLTLKTSQMAHLLSITERTIQRYDNRKKFNSTVSEQILQIAEVAEKGLGVFGNREKFNTWMKQSNTALANKSPIGLMHSRFGIEMVLDILGRMEYGIFS